jgi:membrane-associated protease RseP (regulator of RpoE activity)
MSSSPDYTAIAAHCMHIEELTWGDPKRDFVVRFRGTLTTDKLNARQLLQAELAPLNLSAIVRDEDGRSAILIISDPLTAIVAEILDIEETHWGDHPEGYVARFLGRLTRDSIEAYDFLAASMVPRRLTPLFREEEGKHAVILIREISQPPASSPWINLVLFILTLLSVAIAGAMNVYDGSAADLQTFLREILASIGKGVPFAISLLAILLAHEFGHYIAGRIHKTPVSLPYFLPFPVAPFGTLGAFIRLRGVPRNKRILHDIGIAGPLAGLAVAIPILLIGLNLSHVEAIPRVIPAGQGFSLEGNSILYLLAKYLTFGEWLPTPRTYGADAPWLYWIKFIFTGQPFPLGGRDVIIHPIALAGWGGILVTALNLIPAGQLDGGHILYTLLGRHARRLIPWILAVLFVLGFVWSGWWLWAFLISLLGRTHAEPLDQITRLNPARRLLAIFGLIIFILVFTPIPLTLVMGPAA